MRWMLRQAFLLLSCLLAVAGASSIIDVYRLLQADIDGGAIGSQHYSAKGFMTLPLPNAKTLRGVMAIPLATSQPPALQDYVARRSGLEALLVILPQEMDDESRRKLISLEQQLLGMPVHIPVYFTTEAPQLKAAVEATRELFAKGTPPSQYTDRYELSIQGSQLAQEGSAQPLNYFAMLSGTEAQSKEGPPPRTILITAHYDLLSPAPDAVQGADSNASGVAALLALLHALHALYQSPDTRPSHNTLFLVTSGGSAGHQGLKQWLLDAEPAVLESISFSLALDSLGSRQEGGPLYLHTSPAGSSSSGEDGSSSSSSSEWRVAVQEAAVRLGLQLEVVESAAAAGPVAWAHEQLLLKGIPAATLSSRPTPPQLGVVSSSSSSGDDGEGEGSDGSSTGPLPEELSLQQRALQGLRVGSLGDRPEGLDPNALLEAGQVAAEAVVKLLYPDLQAGLKLVDLLGVGKAAYGPLVQSWVGLLCRSPRMHPLDHDSEACTAMHKALTRFLKTHASLFRRHMWQLDTAPGLAKLAVRGAGAGKLQLYFSAGTMLDMMLLAGVIVYLLLLFAVLKVATLGWEELARVFDSPAYQGGGGRGKGGKWR